MKFLMLAALITTGSAFAQTPNAVIEGTVTNGWVQGGLRVTDRLLDIAIQGTGFFMIESEDQTTCFTRLGRFEMTTEGFLRHLELEGDLVTIVDGTKPNRLRMKDVARWNDGVLKSIRIDLDGKIHGFYTNGYSKVLARIALALFQNQRRLNRSQNHCLQPTEESGDPYLAFAQAEGRGSIYNYTLEEIDDQIYSMALDR